MTALCLRRGRAIGQAAWSYVIEGCLRYAYQHNPSGESRQRCAADRRESAATVVCSWSSVWSFLAIVGLSVAAVALAACLWPSVEVGNGRVCRSAEAGGTKSSGGREWWPSAGIHSALDTPFDVAEAHRNMQLHLSCRPDECPRKAMAVRILEGAGRLTADRSRRL